MAWPNLIFRINLAFQKSRRKDFTEWKKYTELLFLCQEGWFFLNKIVGMLKRDVLRGAITAKP